VLRFVIKRRGRQYPQEARFICLRRLTSEISSRQANSTELPKSSYFPLDWLCLTFGISIAKAYAKSIEGLLVDVPSKGPCSTAKFNNMDMLVKVYVSLTSAPFSFYLTKAKTNTKSSEVESKLPLLTPRFSARSSLRLSGVYQAASFALFLFL
jgi:hypothetical protein